MGVAVRGVLSAVARVGDRVGSAPLGLLAGGGALVCEADLGRERERDTDGRDQQQTDALQQVRE